MLRKLVIVAVLLAVIAAAAFWFITMPETVSADALGPYSPDLDNGKTMFYAGGCAACHATPNQEDKTKLGGGLGLKSPFGTFFAPNISPDRDDGIGGLRRRARREFRPGPVKGPPARRQPSLPGLPLPVVPAQAARGGARSLRLPQDIAGGARQGARPRPAAPFPDPPHARRLEIPLSRRGAVQARHVQAGAVESRRLSRQRFGPLRGVPQPPHSPPRHHRGKALCRRARPGRRRRLGPQHHAGRYRRLLAAGHRTRPRDRRPARRRFGRWPDGGGGRQYVETVGARPRRDR